LVITLGDYIDRGPTSKQVISRLLALRAQCNYIRIRGNHEQMMMEARKGKSDFEYWLDNGGDTTMKSYGLPTHWESLSQIPKSHWYFLDSQCVDIAETEDYIFVHGGLDPQVPIEDQSKENTHWNRFDKARPHYSGKIYFCGHTPQPNGKPTHKGFAVCLDTGVFLPDGWLSCLRLDDGMVFQTNTKGIVRKFLI